MFMERKFNLFIAMSALLYTASAQATLIEVTTTQDHFGEDDTTCSLREAIQASLSKADFGGCAKGERNITDVIKLKDGATYQLNSELKIDRQIDGFVRNVRIDGSDSIDTTSRDTITGLPNERLRPSPTIKAAANHRIFNTAASRLPLVINNVNLEGSSSKSIEYGGVFLIGGKLTLNNVTVKKGYAESGGAIFLEGTNSAVEMSRTLLENNEAGKGAVLSEFCFDNLSYDRRRIEINNSSIVNNKATAVAGQDKDHIASIIHTCGAPVMSIANTTLANNDSSSNGALIDFFDVQIFDSGSKTNVPQLKIDFSTLAANENGIRYSEAVQVKLSNNVVAFNKNYDCRFKRSPNAKKNNRDPKLNGDAIMSDQNNLYLGSDKRGDTNPCHLPQKSEKSSDTNNAYLPVTAQLMDYFESDTALDYGLGLKGLLPKQIDKKNEDKTPAMLLSAVGTSCSGRDMRGMSRLIKDTVTQKNRSCYKGALERARLIAVNDESKSNFSYDDYVERFQARIDEEPDPDFSKEELANFNEIKRQNKALLQAYKDSYDPKKNVGVANFTGYRQVYVSVLNNDIPYESSKGNVLLFPYLKGVKSDGTFEISDAGKYNVTVGKTGVSNADELDSSKLTEDDSLFCRWDKNLQQVIIWRRNTVTPAGSKDYCEYTISYTNKAGKTKSSSAFASASIVNLAPIAKDLSIDTEGTEETIVIDLEAEDVISDTADSPNRPLDRNGKEAFSEFYQTAEGVPRYIQIVKQPELGRIEFSGESGNCPNANASQVSSSTCFSGKMTYIRDNLTGKFDDSFTYKVYDAGNNGSGQGSLASNVATVKIKANRRSGSTPVLEGGGSINFLTLFGLFGLFGLSVYQRHCMARTRSTMQ